MSNFEPGAGSSSPEVFLVNGFVAFVSAETKASGREPWVTLDIGVSFVDTALGDLDPGIADSNPRDFTAATGTGAELFAASPLLFDDGFESGDTSAWSDSVP